MTAVCVPVEVIIGLGAWFVVSFPVACFAGWLLKGRKP